MNARISRRRGVIGQVVVAVFVVIFTVVPGARPAVACSCGDDTPGLAAIFADPATTAFVGRATSVKTKDYVSTYTLEVDRSLKGYAGPTVTVTTAQGGGLCGVEYPLNVQLGVTLSDGDKGRFASGLCGGDIATTNISAFDTWFTGTLPAPTGSGPVAGLGRVGPGIGAVFDKQLRVLGYIGLNADVSLDLCPGGRYAYGIDWTKDPEHSAVLVDLTTLLVTRIPMNDKQTTVWCLDVNGLLALGNPDVGSDLETVERNGYRTVIAAPIDYRRFVGPTDELLDLTWVSDGETVVTDGSGAVLRRVTRTPSGTLPTVQDQYLIDFAPIQGDQTQVNALVVTDLTTGAEVKVEPSEQPWFYSDDHLYRLTDATTLDVIALPDGTRSKITISGGPEGDSWKLSAGSGVLYLYDESALSTQTTKSVYLIAADGRATELAVPDLLNFQSWDSGSIVANLNDGQTWLVSSGKAAPVLTSYFVSGLAPIENGPTLAATACGTTTVPTQGYVCEPPTLPSLL